MLNHVFSLVDVSLINSIPLPLEELPDQFVWQFSNSGAYTVHSGYNLVHHSISRVPMYGPISPMDAGAWNSIWSFPVPHKLQFFIWKCILGILPTRVALCTRIKDIVFAQCSFNPRLTDMAENNTRILFIGGTGYIGKYLVEASANSCHPTFVLVRDSTLSSSSKSTVIDKFNTLGVNFLIGDLFDHESLVKAIKQVDVVISTLGYAQLLDQVRILSAIKEAGNIKRFFPSEFGNDVDPVNAVELNITLCHPLMLVMEWRGNYMNVIFISAAIFNKEEDIATYTIKAVDDPRTLNKTLYIRPPGNIISLNDLVSLWEKKIVKTVERTYLLRGTTSEEHPR
ncbi:Phenylcoumaran benzylic ether reductase POP1 [Linum perenne]